MLGAGPGLFSGNLRLRRATTEERSALEVKRGPGTAAMDIPPLAGKIAALSLSALPVSYALNHVSALSQCVRGAVGPRAALGGAEGTGERMHISWPGSRLEPGAPSRLGRGVG